MWCARTALRKLLCELRPVLEDLAIPRQRRAVVPASDKLITDAVEFSATQTPEHAPSDSIAADVR
jgi:hypothetical protein